MPDAMHMPELHELPPEKDEDKHDGRRGRWSWFIKGFVAAALLFGTFLAAESWFGSSHADDIDGSRIIVGN